MFIVYFQDDFAMALSDMFLQKIEERVVMSAKLGSLKPVPMETGAQTRF